MMENDGDVSEKFYNLPLHFLVIGDLLSAMAW
jgi:hypothetical protein